ncbi:CYTH and CHAD domain-containing protein [Algicola sagamiensis]|uniref:CYTH and CHAD domain-containing protein n=1 Tax=Algicola sagamiensis TaxID=163869 RepID=UPI000375E530|nr:CYTH domain-containing protein [Algicola sagamiensis]
MDTEIEIKLLLSASEKPLSDVLADFCQVLSSDKKQLKNTYYDTPERTLRYYDIGLRTRWVDGAGEQTIKLSGKVVGGMHQRPEFNLPITHDEPNLTQFDSKIWPEGFPFGAVCLQLAPLFSTDFERQKFQIQYENTQAEVVLDQGYISAACRQQPIYEIEIELVDGKVEDLFAIAKHIAAQYQVRLGSQSKAERGYRLADQNPLTAYQSLGSVPLERKMTVVDSHLACLTYGLKTLQHHEQCYLQTGDIVALYRVRDALALIRHTLWLFKGFIPKSLSQALHDDLKWLLGELKWVDAFFHLNILVEYQGRQKKKKELWQALETILNEEQSQLPQRETVEALFVDKRYTRLMFGLGEWLLGIPWKDTLSPLEKDTLVQPIILEASALLERDWREISKLLPEEETIEAEKYIGQQGLLRRNLLTGACLGELFEPEERLEFRAPWMDLLQGIDELATYAYLQEKQTSLAPQTQTVLQSWLARKIESVLLAMEQSRLSGLKLEPYWR